MYCVFDKKRNLSDSYCETIANFNEYDNEDRFLRIGIYDFGESGIVDTFKKNNYKKPHYPDTGDKDENQLTLKDFFDTGSIIMTALTQPDMRYAARLGIKTFVRTIIDHKGYFRVESNVLSNEGNVKRALTTVVRNNYPTLISEDDLSFDFVNGTHFEIVLPVNSSEIFSVPLQQVSVLNIEYEKSFNNLSSKNLFYVSNVSRSDLDSINNSLNKEEQIEHIKSTGEKIINDFLNSNSIRSNEMVLNMNGYKSDALNSIIKLVAYLQLNIKNGLNKIFIVNSTDLFVKELYGKVNEITNVPIWSKDVAIILLSENLYSNIIWGETSDEIKHINTEFQRRYFNNFYLSDSSQNNSQNFINDIETKKRVDSLTKPLYDILISINNEDEGISLTLFESFVYKLLKKKICPTGLGFLVNHKNTYIGNKIIVRNYYEADIMFQNNFFTERFAYLIANNIRKELNQKNKKKLLLIGYKHYSEFLLKSIKKVLVEENKFSKDNKFSDVYLSILHEQKNSTISERFVFNYDIDNENSVNSIKNEIKNNPENFFYVSIVPIGATLSTNDKIVGLFKKTCCPNLPENKDDFIYNHCVIVVRSGHGGETTKLEKEQRWQESGISLHDRYIKTDYENAKKVHYNLLVSGDVNKLCNENEINCDNKDINWERRLNHTISFPKRWWKEEYVNFTENSSINSQNLMGLPNVNIDNKEAEKDREKNHQEELNRLYQLSDNIYKGHIEVLNCHLKYYINTEMFVKKRKHDALKSWLINLKGKKSDIFNQKTFNVIVTPNVERESDFVCAVNNFIFNDSALIIYLDVNNWRNNMVYKLSFLRGLHKNGNIRYHYVDHAFLMGETYHKSKRYLLSIIGELTEENECDLKSCSRSYDEHKEVFRFQSIITIINRLPYAKHQEIKKDVKDNMFAYVNLHYPTSRQGEENCELCKLMNYYRELGEKTVLDSCISVINKNLKKIQITQKKDINENMQSKRNFLRLIIAHEIYYRIAEIAYLSPEDLPISDKIYSDVVAELDGIYSQLSNSNSGNNTKSKINTIINDWLLSKCYDLQEQEEIELQDYYSKKIEVDKKISFLKVISSLPLSQYIIIRKYAHEKLLDELYSMISKTRDNQTILGYEDLKIVKSIIKSLSFLKSNALVRKDVIVGIWQILEKVIEKNNLDNEKEKLNEISLKIERQINIIKSKKGNLENTTSKLDMFSDLKIKELDRRLKAIMFFREELEHDRKSMCAENIIQDFSKDAQFYIKNSIFDDEAKATFLGELLRQGNEMILTTKFDKSHNQKITISKTLLLDAKNDLFSYYDNKLAFKNNDLNETFRSAVVKTRDVLNYKSFKNQYYKTFEIKPNSIISKKDNKTLRREYLNYLNYKTLKREYTNFLVWLFYDNTTIIRKTLDNFYEEIERDSEIRFFFYEDNKKLMEVNIFKNNEDTIKYKFEEKVKKEYYYSFFRPYLENGDGIDYVKKLIYVSYAKLKLKDLIKNKTGIETDTKALMEVFCNIMGADAAFWTMRNNNRLDNLEENLYKLYVISQYGKISDSIFGVSLDGRYTEKIYEYGIKTPLIPKYKIQEHKIKGETGEETAHSLGIFLISNSDYLQKESFSYTDQRKRKRKRAVASITFLYKKDNPLVNNEKDFRVVFQESGRLLLLLKREIDKYVTDYLINDKAFDMWERKFWSNRRFEKIYANSAHIFQNVYDEMDEFDKIKNPKILKTISKTWYFLTNETISFLYSDIEKNSNNSEHYLNLRPEFVIDEKETLGNTFNKRFLTILSGLLESRWNGIAKEEDCKQIKKNVIYINGQTLEKFEFDENDKTGEAKIFCKKHIMRTFVAQLLHNSLSLIGKHGHRGTTEIKRIDIKISKNYIEIEDSCKQEFYELEDKEERKNKFIKKKEYIKNMRCDEYSSTTLTALQGFVNYMNNVKDDKNNLLYNFSCDYNFNDKNNFKVTINFSKK